MRIGDLLYFAPGIRFNQVDLHGPGLPQQFQQRIEGLYIRPVEECVACHHAFAAGLLLVSCIDALARLRFGNGVEKRFTKFAREQLASFITDDLASRFYLEFRNGLVHEARLKEGGQFSLETSVTVEKVNGLLLINPRLLAREVQSALETYVTLLKADSSKLQALVNALQRDHDKDFLFSGE